MAEPDPFCTPLEVHQHPLLWRLSDALNGLLLPLDSEVRMLACARSAQRCWRSSPSAAAVARGAAAVQLVAHRRLCLLAPPRPVQALFADCQAVR